ncbi:gliding motility-associated C-terminal domain-containing protein [Chitinophaga sp. sic0106]|uniref:T9SS type B sorting domain-containing protein n=1 Tax=Chitinophaga sp. sic0106 TaxID=2854785 RepID=UPI001C44E845|nr:gliding motility-associated C-terminal domain-containing protein [Chitinophaga sp. sic0106]MBV7530548.1 DUF11 domain-containing protein [Chitinophaga sp. sic0106]
MTKRTILAIKYCLTALLMVLYIGAAAQSATYKNTTGVSGAPSLQGSTVSDISFTTFQFPAIGLATSASKADIQTDGSYNITYTYTLKNLGGLDLTQVHVNSSFAATFPLPMTYTITSITGQGIAANSGFAGNASQPQLTANSATLAAGATATVTIVLNLKNAGQYGTFNIQPEVSALAGTSAVNDASVNGTVPDANNNGTAFDDKSVTPVTLTPPDIEVLKTTPTLEPYVGDNINFSIKVTNLGGDAAGVTVAETMGNGFTYVSDNAASNGTSYNSGTNTWNIGILKNGESKTLTLTAMVNAAGTYTNTAGNNHPEDIDLTNNTATVNLSPKPSADLQVIKTASADSVNVNSNVSYTLTARNNGPSNATNVVITDQLPAGIQLIESSMAPGMMYNPTTRLLTWPIGAMAAGAADISQVITAKVTEDIDRTRFANTAVISAAEHDSKPANNTSTATVVPKQYVDLEVTKTITAPATLYPLDEVTFTITVRNIGVNNCYDINLVDQLQTGYQLKSASATAGTFVNNAWKFSQLNKGASATLTIVAIVQPKGDYNNAAAAYTTDNDINLNNNKASIVPPVVTPRTDLAVTIAGANTGTVGNNYTFTITATNNGPSDATNVKITGIKLPAGYTFVSATPTRATYDQATGELTIGNLPATGTNKTSSVVLVGKLLPNAANYSITATVSGTEVETTLANNVATKTPNITQVADLQLFKGVDNSTPEVGTNVTFTLTAVNRGPSLGTSVVLTDILPSGYTFVSSNTPLTNGKWNIGNLATNQTNTLTITARVNPTGDYLNMANLKGAETDPVPANNDASRATTPIPLADVVVTKTIDNINPDAGNTVTFTITATNSGPSVAQSVTVTDILASGYSLVTASATVGTYTNGVWSLGDMNAAQTETLTIIAKVLGKGNYSNTATINTSTRDKVPGNNSATVIPIVRPVTDLQIVKTANKLTVDAGTNVVFTLTAKNNGASPATGVTATDLLPDGFALISSAPAAGTSYTSGNGRWTIGNLDSGEVKTLDITAVVNPTGNYVNTATITGDQTDLLPANNTSSVTINRVPVADLEVLKSVDNTTPDVGSIVTFTIKAINHGISKATNVVVTDALPTGYTLVESTPSSGTYTTGTWTIGDMEKDAMVTLTIKARVLASGIYQNDASITGTELDHVPGNNTSSVTPIPVPVADVSVTKSISNAHPDAGNSVTFTITATNNGPNTATNVTVTDILQSGYTFVSAMPSVGTYNPGTGVWSIGNMALLQTATLTITANVLPTGDYSNTATITSPVKDNDNTNNTSTITPPVVRPITDLAIIKQVDRSTADAGTNVVFTLKATNNGPSTATGVVVQDVLPTGYSLISAGSGYNAGTWTIGTLNSGASQTLTITAMVQPEGIYENTAAITGNEHDPVATNNSSSVTVTRIPVTDLEVIKTASSNTPDAGSVVTFTITAINHGISKATGVIVTDALPDGYTFIEGTPSAGTYVADKWTIGDLGKDATATLLIKARVLASGHYQNDATITGTETDHQLTNNSSSVTPVPVPVADLSVTKTIDNSQPDAGSTVTFTILAKNDGPGTATAVTVTDQLLSGYQFKSATASTGAYDATTGIWTVGSMTIGQSATLAITATVLPTGDYDNTATITSPVKDNDNNNNTAGITPPVVRPITDLAIEKTADKITSDAGAQVVFTLKATNNGPSTATQVKVLDQLPTGFTFVSATPGYDATTGIWTIGTLNSGGSKMLTITATVNPEGNYLNSAAISGKEHDPVATNNTSAVTITRVAVADLEVTKSADNNTPDVGTNVTFTITASNHGPSTATHVVVTDAIPDGYTLLTATPATGSFANGQWSIGTLNSGGNATLTVVAQVLASGIYTNTATISGTEADRNNANNNSSVTPIPVPVANISVVKNIRPQSGTSNQVTFTITAKNDGPGNASNVTVTDILPSGYNFDQANTSKGNYNAGTGIWTIGNLANGETATIDITANLSATGDYSNSAVIKASEKDKTPDDNTSTVTPTVTDLQVIKTISNTRPPHGSDVTFTITAGNNGPNEATGVTVTDILPAGYTFKSADTKTGRFNNGSWTIGNLANGATVELRITATVNKTGDYANTATITGNEKDRDLSNNSSTVIPTPVPLSTKDDAASTEEPDPVTIDVIKNDTYGNTGHTVFIKDQPQHGTIVDNGDGTVTYTPEAGFGGTDQFTYYIQDQSGFASNVSTVTIDVTKRLVDLAIKKVIVTPPAEIAVGKNVTFEITVTNNSRKGASNVVVTDILANNVGDMQIQTSADNGKEGYDPISKTMSWKLDTLAPGQTVKLKLTAKLLSGGVVNNTATVAGGNADPDPDNNTATSNSDAKGPDIFVPNAFTPNGDGINDRFVILGIDRYPNSQLIVFNRWGNIVYRSNDYRNNWDGSGLNEGTYYYELICNTPANGKVSLKGWIQLVR